MNCYEKRRLWHSVIECGRMFYGLTAKGLQRFAFQFAKANGKPGPLSGERDGCAGEDWALGFRRRLCLSLRIPENTSLSRAVAVNPTNVSLLKDYFLMS